MLLAAFALLTLVVRLWTLQFTQWNHYAREAAGNRTKIVWESAPRGLIKDRHGLLLAENHPQWDVEIVPAEYPKKDQVAAERIVRTLTQILEVPMPEVRAALKDALSRQALDSGVLTGVGEDVPFKVVAQIEARKLELPGVQIGIEVRRNYPRGRLAAHVLGYARAITASQYEDNKDLVYPGMDPQHAPPLSTPDDIYAADSLVGQAGVEKLLETTTQPDYPGVIPLLQGRRGYRLYEVKAGGAPTGIIAERPPVPGASVCLTLDAQLQKVAEDALDETLQTVGTAGAVVLMDAQTGEVLVMASRPTYDANQWVKGFTPQQWQALTSNPSKPLINHATAMLYPPGSIFKMISAAAALSTTNLSLNDSYTCSGGIYEGADHARFGCWTTHGIVDFLKGIAESCDVYFYNLVLSKGLSSDTLADFARRFGLGSRTGIGLSDEVAGTVPDRDWKLQKYQTRWTTGETLHYVIGQGYLSVTPLQMAVVTAAVANGGWLLTPRLINSITWPAWTGYGLQTFTQPEGHKVDVAPKVLEEVRQGMRLAVTSEHGTAGAMRNLGVSVGGKTGSAETDPSRPAHAWFTCFAPYENPKYVAVVFVAEGKHGASAAAPIACKVMAAALGIKPTGPAGTGPAGAD